MNFIRSLIYVAWLYGTMAAIAISFAPFALFSERAAITAARIWARWAIWGLRIICGVRLEIRGREYIPTGAALVASKHQSMMDTIVPLMAIGNPSIILKKELRALPLFGWYTMRSGMITINREAQAAALRTMLRDARARVARNRPVLIFPEGTRQPLGTIPDYKPGVAALYRDLKLPCTPVAANSGKFWPAHGVTRRPGLAVIEFLPAIPPGLSREDFMTELKERIETASNRLLEETR